MQGKIVADDRQALFNFFFQNKKIRLETSYESAARPTIHQFPSVESRL